MDLTPHLVLFEMAMNRVYPDLKFDIPIVMDNEFVQDYFHDRKIFYFCSTEDFQIADCKIKWLRNILLISGTIDKVSSKHTLRRFTVNTAVKIGIKRKEVPDILEKLGDLSTNIRISSEEVCKIGKEILELEYISAQTLWLDMPNAYYSGFSDHKYPLTYQEHQSDHVEMLPRVLYELLISFFQKLKIEKSSIFHQFNPYKHPTLVESTRFFDLLYLSG